MKLISLLLLFLFCKVELGLAATLNVVSSSSAKYLEFSISADESNGTYKIWNLTQNKQVGSDIKKSSGKLSDIVKFSGNPGDKYTIIDSDGEVIATVVDGVATKTNTTGISGSPTSSSSAKSTAIKASNVKKFKRGQESTSGSSKSDSSDQIQYLTQLKQSYLDAINQMKSKSTDNSKSINKRTRSNIAEEQWDTVCQNATTSMKEKNIVSTTASKDPNSLESLCASRVALNSQINEAYQNFLKTEKLETEAKADTQSATTTEAKSTAATTTQTVEEKEKELNDKYGGNLKMGNAQVSDAERWEKWRTASQGYYTDPSKFDSITLGVVDQNNKTVGGYLSPVYIGCGNLKQVSSAYATHVILAMNLNKIDANGKIGIPVELCKILGQDLWCQTRDLVGNKMDTKLVDIDTLKDGGTIVCPNDAASFTNNPSGWVTGKLVNAKDKPILGEFLIKGQSYYANPNPSADYNKLFCDGGNYERFKQNVLGPLSVSDENGLFYFTKDQCPEKNAQVYTACIFNASNMVRPSPTVSLADFKAGVPVKCPDYSKIMINCKDPFGGSNSYSWGTRIQSYSSNLPCAEGKCPTKEHVCEDNGVWSNLPIGGKECLTAKMQAPAHPMFGAAAGIPTYMCGTSSQQVCPNGYAPAGGTERKCEGDYECKTLWPRSATSLNCPVDNLYLGKLDCSFICPK